jgi:hypothetical protein
MPTRAYGQALKRLRSICLTLPEAAEVEAWGHPTFRAGRKMFADLADFEQIRFILGEFGGTGVHLGRVALSLNRRHDSVRGALRWLRAPEPPAGKGCPEVKRSRVRPQRDPREALPGSPQPKKRGPM